MTRIQGVAQLTPGVGLLGRAIYQNVQAEEGNKNAHSIPICKH